MYFYVMEFSIYIFIYFLFFNLYWSIIALQCCVSFYGPIFLDDYISKGQLPGSRERHFWVVVEDLHLQVAKKTFMIAGFLK